MAVQVAMDRLPGWIDGFDCRTGTAETRYRRRCDLPPRGEVERASLQRWREEEGGIQADPTHEEACPKRRVQVQHPEVLAWLDDYGDWSERGGWRGPPGLLPAQPARWLLAQRVIAAEVSRLLSEERKGRGNP